MSRLEKALSPVELYVQMYCEGCVSSNRSGVNLLCSEFLVCVQVKILEMLRQLDENTRRLFGFLELNSVKLVLPKTLQVGVEANKKPILQEVTSIDASFLSTAAAVTVDASVGEVLGEVVWVRGQTVDGRVCEKAFLSGNGFNGCASVSYSSLKQDILVKNVDQAKLHGEKRNCAFMDSYFYYIVAAKDGEYIGRVKTEGKK